MLLKVREFLSLALTRCSEPDIIPYTVNLYSSRAAESKTIKTEQQSDFRAPTVGFILSLVWPVRSLIMTHVIV